MVSLTRLPSPSSTVKAMLAFRVLSFMPTVMVMLPISSMSAFMSTA